VSRQFPDSSSGFVVERTFKIYLLLSKRRLVVIPVGNLKVDSPMKEKPDVLQGTLALMVLKTLDILGPRRVACN
jgi:hypothetical protein